MSKKPRYYTNKTESRLAHALDDLEAYEQFKTEILPALRADIKDGKTPEEIRQKYKTVLEAKKIMIAVFEEDSSKALAAIKDIQDRSEGRAVERIQQVHKFEKLPDEELDALVLSKLKEADGSSKDKDKLPN